MGLVNPLYALTIIPSLVLVTIPLAILATITTTLAISVLFLRVLTVYLDLVVSFVPQTLAKSSSPSPQQQKSQQSQHQHRPRSLKLGQSPPPPPPPLVLSSPHSSTRSLHHHRRRRRSSASVVSTPAAVIGERGLGLIPSVGADRDYEGIGGWRRGHGGGPGQSDDDDELAWTTVNPPLQLQLPRHHARSASGPSSGVVAAAGPTTPGEGGTYLVMRSGRARSPEVQMGKRASPNCSRARTPSGPRPGFIPLGASQQQQQQHHYHHQPSEGYFSLNPVATGPAQSLSGASPKATRKGPAHPVDQN